MRKRPTLHAKIIAPTSIVFDGEAYSVSAENHVGPFDILAGHVNFFTLLSSGDVTIDAVNSKQVFRLQKGILKVQDDLVTIYANIGMPE